MGDQGLQPKLSYHLGRDICGFIRIEQYAYTGAAVKNIGISIFLGYCLNGGFDFFKIGARRESLF